MDCSYTKKQLKTMDDRFENYFSLPFETNELPDSLVEMKVARYSEKTEELRREKFSLLVCIPHLPVPPIVKRAQLLGENNTFRLWKVSSEFYNRDIEDFLAESEYAFTTLWIKDPLGADYELPKTSQQRLKISALKNNEIHCFWMELEECVKVVWN